MSADSYKRVLVVDDDPGVRTLLGALLRKRGLVVDEAPGGQEALDLLASHSYTVILLDLLMPEPDGFAVLRVLDQRPTTMPMPIVLVLTAAHRSILDGLDSQHIHGIVRKPFDPDELAGLVMACSEVRSRHGLGMMAVAMMSSARLIDLLG